MAEFQLYPELPRVVRARQLSEPEDVEVGGKAQHGEPGMWVVDAGAMGGYRLLTEEQFTENFSTTPLPESGRRLAIGEVARPEIKMGAPPPRPDA